MTLRETVTPISRIALGDRPSRELRTRTSTVTTEQLAPAWRDPVACWLDWLAAGSSRIDTLNQRAYQLRRVARDHADTHPWDVSTDDLAGWLSSHRWGREAIRSYRAALRSFYGWAHATGRTTANPAALLRPVRPEQPRVRPASAADVAVALLCADPRQRLAIRLAAAYGLRRGEIAVVHSRDVWHDGNGWAITVHGKGGKLRDLPLDDVDARELRLIDGWAFPNGRGGHLTPAHLGKVICRALPDGVTTHKLRHRFATDAYWSTSGNLRVVQELLGHASPVTTQIYTHIPSAALRSAVRDTHAKTRDAA